MEPITYSLKADGIDSEQYYRDVRLFADEVTEEARGLIGPAVRAYMSHVEATVPKSMRSESEYVLELLALGVLWREYGDDGMALPEFPGQLLAALADLRQIREHLKPGIDFLRGILGTIFLSPDFQEASMEDIESLVPNIGQLVKLADWLDATGDFVQEEKRIRPWIRFFGTLGEAEAKDHLASATTLAAWFDYRSAQVLGRYTANVERFLADIRPSHRWKEDYIFCGRRRVEYHLNMVGAEMMNRAFREDFTNAERKAVLVPSCLCALPSGGCKAVETEDGLICAGCHSRCRVNRLNSLGKAHGFDVLIITHGSSALSENRTARGRLAVIGIACVLNLVSGGWKARSLGIPAQCVLLDYCGCRNHWDKEGMVTDINWQELERILGCELALDEVE